MKPAVLARLVKLVLGLKDIGAPESGKDAGSVLEKRDLTLPSGNSYHLFMPVSPIGVTVIAAHGVTVYGNNDVRILQFARALTACGVVCVLPDLHHIANGCFHTKDLDLISELIKNYQQNCENRLGLVGFSYSGSYVLTAAANKEFADKVTTVTVFGPCYSMAESFAVSETFKAVPETDLEWDKYIHFSVMGVHRFGREMGVSADIAAECETLLRDYCSNYSIEYKRQFYMSRLARFDPIEYFRAKVMHDPLDELSPKGRLAGIKCRVSLIHGSNDHMIHASESQKIYAELKKAGLAARCRLLVTGLLGHVHPGRIGPFELLRFMKSLRLLIE
ncbi:MAG: hypothetical protein GQF41_3046 [Candidatus Rifleibacterium amylolyticum]|nr:MAG: hypothetical protein GQF41_3046 [Candidatus Rifleibacterium amylolyticum]